jgi:hypothetical protein
VLTDYGIAKMIGVTQHTAAGTVMGSAFYMSPEQAQGIAVDGRSDIYSLGVMLFESLAGQVPYEGDTLATVLVKHITAPVPAVCPLNAELPPLLDGLMRVALAKDPDKRFQTGKALAAALRQGLAPLAAQSSAVAATATRVERPSSSGAAPQGFTRVETPTPAPAKPPRERATAHDVFISYAASDKAVADAVCTALESESIRCWIAPRDVLPGQSFARALVNAIHEARVFVLVFSSATNNSQQVERELDRAASSRLPILPLRVEDVLPRESIEYYLAGQHWLDALTPPLADHLERLTVAIAALLQRSAPPLAEGPPEATASEPAVWATGAPAGTTYEPVPAATTYEPAPKPEPEPEAEAPVAEAEPVPKPEAEAPAAEAEPAPAAATYEPAPATQPTAEASEAEAEPALEIAAPEPVGVPEAAVAVAGLQAATTYEPVPEAEPEPEPSAEPPEAEPEAVLELEPEAEAPEAEPKPEAEAPEAEDPEIVPLPEPEAVIEPEPEAEAPEARAEPPSDLTTLERPVEATEPQAATTYEPAPVPATGTSEPPPAVVPALGERAGEASEPSRQALHKPTLIAAAAVGIAWIVVLLVIDQVFR